MTEMFYDCSSLTSLDVSSFDTSKCTRMNNMFGYCKYLEELDLSNFNTSKVTLMTGMFEMCQRLTLLDLSNFNMKKVSSKSSMLSRTASVSRNCVIRCTSATETALPVRMVILHLRDQ
jgi:surface protein